MSHQKMRCNLAATIFPFASPLAGRTIIVPQYDQNYEKTLVSSADTDKDKGIPQAVYMHNVMPVASGYQSIGYVEYLEAMDGDPTDFDAAFPIQNTDLARFIMVPSAGKNYLWDAQVGLWRSVSPITGLPGNVTFTTAFINGQSYMFYEATNCYVYNDSSKALDVITLAGLTVALITGICAANGYMIAFDDTSVSWSSQTDPLDFVPSLVTGAGGGGVVDAKGRIICCLPISGGFIVYCEKNIVAARYTGNARYPYNFKELANSGGIQSPEQVSWQGNTAEHYAWTTAGLQKVDLSACTNLVPEVTDFLSMLLFEDFDEITLMLSETYLDAPLNVKVAVISSRFLVVSYGVVLGIYTHALIFDLVLKRWGKVKVTHVDCFQWNAPNLYGALTYGQLTMTYGGFGPLTTYADLGTSIQTPEIVRKTIAFMQQDGRVVSMNFDFSQPDANGVLILGKFQFQRNKMIAFQTIEIENTYIPDTPPSDFIHYLFPTLDGKTFLPAVSTTRIRNSPMSSKWGRMYTGQNVSSLFFGKFNLTSCIYDFTLGGDR